MAEHVSALGWPEYLFAFLADPELISSSGG
jgi:hypothetical protein